MITLYGAGLRTLVLLALLLPGARAAAQVEGRVVDENGTGLAGVVFLEVHDGQQMIYQREAAATADGGARWDDIPEAEGLLARLRTVHNGAEYISETVTLDNGAGTVVLTVRPIAREGRPLHLDTLHLIVQADDPGLLRVLQFMTVSNAGAVPFAGGPQLDDGRQAGLVIPLPAGAISVQPAPFPTPKTSLDPATAQFGSDRILDARPVPVAGRQVAVTYALPPPQERAEVALLLPYPTQEVSLLLGGTGRAELTLQSDILAAESSELIGEEEYDLFTAQALSPGTDLTFEFTAPGFTLSVKQVSVLGVGIALLAAVAGSVFGGQSGAQSDRHRASIVDAITTLDDAHAAGTLDESDYFERRGRELERLSLLEGSPQDSSRAHA